MSGLKDSVKVTGEVTLRVFDSKGRIKEAHKHKNLVVDTGLAHIASRVVSNSDQGIVSKMAIGESNTTPAAGNTTLGTELTRKTLTDFYSVDNKITATCTFAAGEGTSNGIVEAGLFNEDDPSVMLCRTTFPSIGKEAGDALAVTWEITIS